MARLLHHDDISKAYYREKSIKYILPEITNEMMRLVKRYPHCLNDASYMYNEFTYICTIIVDTGFVRRFAGPLKLEIKNPIVKAKEWFGKKFLELTNSLPEIHKEHSGKINYIKKVVNEDRKMNELCIRIPTIQIVVHDEWDGLYD